MYASEAEAWQNSLHQFIDLTDRNITILQAERDLGVEGDKSSHHHRSNSANRRASSGSMPSYQRPRTASTARGGGSTNQVASGDFNSANNANPTTAAVSANNSNNIMHERRLSMPISMAEKENILYEKSMANASTDVNRQYQNVFKKNQFLQDKLKKVEDINSDLVKNLSICNSNLERLTEQQKQDKQMMLVMRDQFSALKQQVDVLNSKQLMDKSLKGNRANEIDEDSIYERVLHKMQHEVKTSIRDYNAQHENDKSEFMKQLHDNSMGECRKFFQASNINSNSIRDMEKEILKLRSDTNGMKTKQGYLDTMYNELRDGILIREKKIEDIHRSAISGYKLDMNAVVESVGRRVNDALAGMHTSMKLAEIPALWKRLEELNQAIRVHNQAGRVDALEEKYNDSEIKMKYLTSAEFVQDIFEGNVPVIERRFLLGAPMHAPPISSKMNVFYNWKSQIEAKLHEVEDSNAKFTQVTSQALLDCEKKTSDAKNYIERVENTTDKYVVELVDAGKVTRKRIQELIGTVNGLIKSKQASDDLIAHFDNKMKTLTDNYEGLMPPSRGSISDQAARDSENILAIFERMKSLESDVQALKKSYSSSTIIATSSESNSGGASLSVNSLNQKSVATDIVVDRTANNKIDNSNNNNNNSSCKINNSSSNADNDDNYVRGAVIEGDIDRKLLKLNEFVKDEIRKMHLQIADKVSISSESPQKIDERLLKLESISLSLQKEYNIIYDLCIKLDDEVDYLYNGDGSGGALQQQQQQRQHSEYQQPATEAITVPKRIPDRQFDRSQKHFSDNDDDADLDYSAAGTFFSSQLSALESLALQEDLYDSIEGNSKHSDTLFMASDISKDPIISAPVTSTAKSYHTIKSTSNSPSASSASFSSIQRDTKPSSLDTLLLGGSIGSSGSAQNVSNFSSSPVNSNSRQGSGNVVSSGGRPESPQYGLEQGGGGFAADNYQNISNLMSDKNKYRVKYSRDI